MKSFKSFDDFINESYTRSTGTKGTLPLNEALLSFLTPDQKFKVDEDKPDAKAGELAAFHFVMKMETENPDEAKKNAADQLSTSSVVMNKVNANTIVFIAVTKDKERSLTGQQIFKGILSVRDAAQYDASKAQPFLTSSNGKLKLYKAEDATKMNADLNPPVKPELIKVETGTSGSSGSTGTAGSSGSSGTGGTGGVFPWDWYKIAADDQILKYLKEKLLAFEIVSVPQKDPNSLTGQALQTGIKVSRGSKGQEVKFAQLILKEKVFVDKYGDPAKRVQDKIGNADGNFGPNTAVAFGMFFDSKDGFEHNAISAENVEYLAKYCTKVGITLARLKELWELAGKGTAPITTSGTAGSSGSSGTGGTGGTGGTSGQTGFIYINKPGGASAPTIVPAAAVAPAEGTAEKK